jgi:hypothetical protein
MALGWLEVVLHVATALQSPRATRTPKDERERLIDLKATRLAFPVVLVGAFAAMGTMHLDAGRWVMAHVMTGRQDGIDTRSRDRVAHKLGDCARRDGAAPTTGSIHSDSTCNSPAIWGAVFFVSQERPVSFGQIGRSWCSSHP